MKKGCCLGCLVIVFVAVVALLGAGIWGLNKFDVLRLAPQQDTAAVVGEDAALLVQCNPTGDAVIKVLNELNAQGTIAFQNWFMPYEITAGLHNDPERGVSEQVIAVSMRRFTSLLGYMFNQDNPEIEKALLPDQKLIQLGKAGNGLFTGRFELPLNTELMAQVSAWWPDPVSDTLSLEGGHLLELVMENRDGRALLAVEPLVSRLEPMEEDPGKIEVMKTPGGLSRSRLPGFFRRLQTLRMTCDITGKDRTAVTLEAVCRDKEAAESMLFFMMIGRDAAWRNMVESGVGLEGAFQLDGTRVTGDFMLTGLQQVAEKMQRENQNQS